MSERLGVRPLHRSPLLARAAPFLEAGVLSLADVYAVDLVAGRYGETDVEALLGLAFAVRAPRLGHAGVELSGVRAAVEADEALWEREGRTPRAAEAPLAWPEPDDWAARTHSCKMVSAAGEAGGSGALRPFVTQALRGEGAPRTLLLTARMYAEQERVARALRARASSPLPAEARIARLDNVLTALFPDEPDGEAARVVRRASEQRLTLVIGGPGTGKTYSITRLLAALYEGGRTVGVALAAPTGKAAARMLEALREASTRLPVASEARARLEGLEAKTLHRLLGVRPDGSCRHGPSNPLPHDVVVVDEASMVDLVSMRRLVEAVRPDARLVLLGDRDQLASVEAGSVLADLVAAAPRGPLAEHVCFFTRSYRFEGAPDVALVAACLQSYDTRHADLPAGESARLWQAERVLAGEASATGEQYNGRDGRPRRVTWMGEPEAPRERGAPRPSAAQLDALARGYTEGFASLAHADAPPQPGYASLLRAWRLPSGEYAAEARSRAFHEQVLAAFDKYRVLAVHRAGPLGVSGLERALGERIRAYLKVGDKEPSGTHWIGRPVLVTENAYDVRLLNGDVGLVLPTATGVAVVFPGERAGEVREVAPSRLPPHEGALAMTVHKAQGSQFDRVALVLAGRDSPIQTRELVYTGVTRAKDQLAWLGRREELARALGQTVVRASGLAELLGATECDGMK